VPLPTYAQSLTAAANRLEQFADAANTWVPYLQDRASLITWMTVAVIVMGAVGTITALLTHKAVRWITATITAGIAIVSGVKSEVLKADKESFAALATAVANFVSLSKAEIGNYRAAIEYAPVLNDEDRTYYTNTFSELSKALNAIQTRAETLEISILTPRAVAWLSVPGVAALLASQAAPKVAASMLVGAGTGVCSSTSGAREYARSDGRRRLALQLDPTASPERLDALIGSLDGLAVDQWSRLTADKATRRASYSAQVTLNRALSPSAAGVPQEGRPAPRYSASAVVPAGFAGRLEVGAPQVPRGLEGAFRFSFTVTRRAGAITAELVEIATYNDSSPGSTRWSFDVLAGATRLFSVPMRRLEDSGRPTICYVSPDERLRGTATVTASGPVELRVLGFKPKDL
jgi:hypothetical protein